MANVHPVARGGDAADDVRRSGAEDHVASVGADLRVAGRSIGEGGVVEALADPCLLYTSPSPRDRTRYRLPSSA